MAVEGSKKIGINDASRAKKAKATELKERPKSETMIEWENTLKDLKNNGVRVNYWQKDKISYRAYVKGFISSVITELKKHDKRIGFQVFILNELPEATGQRSIMIQHYGDIRGVIIYPEKDYLY